MLAKKKLAATFLAILLFATIPDARSTEAGIRPCPSDSPASAEVTEVAPGIFVRQGVHSLMTTQNLGGIANIGFVIGEKAVAVIDTGGSACDGERLRLAIRARTSLPIAYVINTHVHPDHIFGNAAFVSEKPTFIGHARLPRALALRGEYYLRAFTESMGEALMSPTRIIPPSMKVETQTTIDLGNRKLILQAHPTAHTDNDLTVYDENTRTLWTGDVVFLGHIPVIDGSLKGWLSVLDDVAKIPAARAVPGHGPVSVAWPDAMKPERKYLQKLAADLRKFIAEDGSIMDAAKHAATEEAKHWKLHEDFHARNANAGFAELEWE